LITTLYEHKNPVNCFAVTDDSQYFFTASGRDGIVNIWSTHDIERDITSHSQFTIKDKRQIRAITTI
jgi:WD40 repeat protein